MGSLDLPHASSFKGGSETFLRSVFESILKTYLRKNPTAKTIWELVQSVANEKICYDHFTFRTLKVDGYGIDSLSNFFMDYGYKIGGGLDFPKKKLRVLWFSPPDVQVPNDGHGLANGPLPRLVIAEVLVDELSLESQGIIRKYLKPQGGKQAILSSTLGSLIWEKPTWADFTQLAKESEFAAWTLIHGYTMNHLAFAVHRFKHRFSDIKCVKEYLEEKGFKLNSDGGILKVSQDGLLLQVSSISERLAVEFADGATEIVPASYIEFTQRLVLPQFNDMPVNEIREYHRREAFELDSANHGIIRKYLKPQGGKQAILSSTLGSLIWEKPTWADFTQLAKESEFAAWTLIHGYTMNHLAFAVHRFKHRFSDIKCVKEYLEEKGFKLNSDGGILKVSQDGLLLQVSSISERLAVEFADGATEIVPASYIEFTQRLVLPQFNDMPVNEIREYHRREAFELDSANHVMESTRFATQF